MTSGPPGASAPSPSDDVSSSQRDVSSPPLAARQYARLLELLGENVTVLDAAGRVQFSTSGLLRALGYGAEDVWGQSGFEALHREDRPRAEALFRQVASGAVAEAQQRLRVAQADGGWRTLECVARNLLADPDVAGVVITSRDVTAEVVSREKLARREEQLQLVLSQMPCLLWTTDRELVLTSVRGRAESLAELVGRRLDDVAPNAPGAAEMVESHRAALAGESATYAVTMRDVPYEARVQPLRIDGRVEGVIGVAVDMTSHLETENRLRMQREVLQRILDNLPLMVALYDGGGNFIWVNRFWTDTLGWTLEDTWRRDFLQRMVREPGASEHFRRVIADGSGEWHDVQLTTRTGAVMTVSWSNVRLPDGTCVGIGRDVTEIRRAADQLRESEERYRLLIESSDHVFFYVHDLDGVFQYVSPSVEAVLGYPPEDLTGTPFSRLLVHGTDAEVLARTNAAFEQRAAQPPYQAVNRRRDGTEVLLEIAESPVIRDGVVVGMQGFGRDVTQLQRLQEQVQHAQKMEAVGRLAGGVAHDFNNILTVIDGNADIALLEEDLGEPLRECLQQIRTASERGARLTRQLLAFSRKQVVQRATLDLNECVLHMHSMLRRLIGDDVLLRVDVSPRPNWILADAGQVEQILLNLAVNARAAMPGGGELRITTRPAAPGDGSGRPAGEWVLLEVQDSGHGIDPAVLPHIFEPFFTTRERGEGTGLGLATTYAIVEASGGWIDVDSKPGEGARFRIFLPRTDGAPEPVGVRPAEPVSGGAETILLAEDDPAVRGVVRHTLRRLGYTLREAANGAAALELLRSGPAGIALLVTDVMMPVMGGIELVREARALRPDLPVLFISGYTDDAPDLGRSGSAPLLHKPFTAGQLAAAVRDLLDDARTAAAD